MSDSLLPNSIIPWMGVTLGKLMVDSPLALPEASETAVLVYATSGGSVQNKRGFLQNVATRLVDNRIARA